MTGINDDGNMLGRFLALALIGAAAAGVHALACDSGACPLMSGAGSCCAPAAPAAPAAAPAPKKIVKPATKPSAAAPVERAYLP